MQDKLVWVVIHSQEELLAFFDNRHTLAPRKHRSKKPGNFYVLFFAISMWDDNRIKFDECGLIESLHFFVQEGFELCGFRRSLLVISYPLSVLRLNIGDLTCAASQKRCYQNKILIG